MSSTSGSTLSQAAAKGNPQASSADSISRNPLQDDSSTVFSVFSTWSTNYTFSNLPGPGRVLGRLFSRGGMTLERRLGKLAYRAGVGSYARAERSFERLMYWFFEENGSRTQQEREEACEALLQYARSPNHIVQHVAFLSIVCYTVGWPWIRNICNMICRKRNENIDIITYSWKRPGIDYCDEWLYFYHLVRRCLSAESSPLMDALEELEIDLIYDKFNSLDFLELERILLCCRDITDMTLAIQALSWHWNGSGIETYVHEKGFSDQVLYRLAIAFVARYEAASSERTHPIRPFKVDRFDPSFELLYGFSQTVSDFVDGLWNSLHKLDVDKITITASDETQLRIWIEILTLHCAAHSHVGRTLHCYNAPVLHTTWRKKCFGRLPDSRYKELCETLSFLDDAHGAAIRDRFPPYVKE